MVDPATTDADRWHVLTSGAVVALVGFASAAMVVLAGLTAVGATPAQAASGLAVLCIVQGVCTIAMSHRYKTPIMIVWSTPGAALLAGTEHVSGGWAAATGAFIVVGLRVGATIGLINTVVAELYTAVRGLGGLLAVYGNTFRMAEYFVIILILASIGVLVTELLRHLQKRLERWRGESAN